ncbi:cytochrome oxidase [Myxococcus stipitatus]|uniref:cytochrome oxidase n=1 Tax=Myxococcus stipitatus TaxID=83455 RepID=UPI001F3FD413|nr:cytochrome oxidase [Myxococcus stipitatus]MCE9667629.1 cytochrome oxidase [Myxococcus stipitatus]
MNVLVLQVFVSLMLVASSVLLFVYSVKHRDHEHADRLALFPLEEDGARPASPPIEPPSSSASQE